MLLPVLVGFVRLSKALTLKSSLFVLRPSKVVAFSFFEPMSEREAKRDGVKGLERREDMIRRNYFTGIRYVGCQGAES